MAILVRKRASSTWTGPVDTGSGRIRTASGAVDNVYTLRSRETLDGPGTNPEELIGAGLAGCFAMSLSSLLQESDYVNVEVTAKATVQLEQTDTGFSITRIELAVEGQAMGLTTERFTELAEVAERTCPVSRALAGTTVVLASATVINGAS